MHQKSYLIKSAASKEAVIDAIKALDINAGPWIVSISDHKNTRSARQNALFHLWCREIAKQSGDHAPEEIKALAKLTWGVPILVSESPQFAAAFEAIKKSLTYEELLSAMEWFPVTSLMSTEQMSQFLQMMHMKSSAKYRLTHPEDVL